MLVYNTFLKFLKYKSAKLYSPSSDIAHMSGVLTIKRDVGCRQWGWCGTWWDKVIRTRGELGHGGPRLWAGDGFLLFSNVELGIWILLPLYTLHSYRGFDRRTQCSFTVVIMVTTETFLHHTRAQTSSINKACVEVAICCLCQTSTRILLPSSRLPS